MSTLARYLRPPSYTDLYTGQTIFSRMYVPNSRVRGAKVYRNLSNIDEISRYLSL